MGLVLVEMKASQTAQSFLDIMREVSRSNHGFDHLRSQVLKWDVIVCKTIGIGDRNTEKYCQFTGFLLIDSHSVPEAGRMAVSIDLTHASIHRTSAP